jgi:cytochrome P450
MDRMDAQVDVDLMNDLAAAILVEVIGNLLAVPLEDREQLREWSLAVLGVLEPVAGEEVLDRGKAVEEFLTYLEVL